MATAAEFVQRRSDVRIEWDQLPWPKFRALQYAGTRDTRNYDLFTFDHPWVGDFATNGHLLPLDDFMSQRERAELAGHADPGSLESYRWNGALWALPIDAAAHVVVFRPDLIGSAHLPASWEELFELAMSMHDPPRRYAFTVPWGQGSATILFFLALLAAMQTEPLADRSRARLDGAAAIDALDLMRRIWRASVPGAHMRGRRAYELMREEDVTAFGIGSFAFITYFGDGQQRPIAIGDVPRLTATGARISMLGGVGLGLSPHTKHREAAWDYMRFVMSASVQQTTYTNAGGQPGSRAALMRRQPDDERTQFSRELVRALDGCYMRPRYPGWITVEKGADDALEAFLSGQCEARTVIDVLNDRSASVWAEQSDASIRPAR